MNLLGVVFADARVSASRDDADFFVRRTDLVATYPQSAAGKKRVQVYWRCLPAGAVGLDTAPSEFLAFELRVSVQTDSVDVIPEIVTRSRLPAQEATQLDGLSKSTRSYSPSVGERPIILSRENGGCSIVCPLSGGGGYYVEMVHPADFQRTEINAPRQGWIELRNHLFSGRLTKGVILRARVRGVLLHGTLDEQLIDRAYTAFVSAAPPLTA